jgi:hypothetical protein
MPVSKPAETKRYGLYEATYGTPHLNISPDGGETSEQTSGPRKPIRDWSEEEHEV